MSNPFNQAGGHQIGEQLAVNVLGASSAHEAAQAIRRALLELRKLDHPKQSATGFVNALTAIFTDGQTPSETAICNGPSNLERESEYCDFLASLPDSEVMAAPGMADYFKQKDAAKKASDDFAAMADEGVPVGQDSGVTCPVCAESAIILNVERNHFAVCHECGVYFRYGYNLFSAWRDESPEVWEENSKTLDRLTEVRFKSDPPPPDDLADLPF